MGEKRFIVFGIDEELYSLDLSFVKGIEENYVIIPIPNSPEDIKGMISLRGEVIPVFSLRSRFGKEPLRGGGKLALVIVRGTIIGFEVDYIKGIETVYDEDILAAPRIVMCEYTSYIDCVVNTSGGIVINISVENVISDEEFDDISALLEENS